MGDILTLGNAVEIRSADTQAELIGYGLALAGDTSAGEPSVVHRWFLLTRDRTKWPPNRAVVFQTPQDTAWQITDKATFASRARANFSSSTYYVKAYCAQTPNVAGPPVTIRRGVAPPSFPLPDPGGSSQTDVGVCPILLPGTPDQTVGYVLTRNVDTLHSLEYWALLPAYRQPGSSAIKLGKVLGGNSSDDLPFLLDSVTWDANCSFIVSACTYYDDMAHQIPAGQE